jgi:acyl-homoserine-lactone acylase
MLKSHALSQMSSNLLILTVFKNRFFHLCLFLIGLILTCFIVIRNPGIARIQRTEILWDTWGVPHIFAKDKESLARAFGWAQMQNHGNLLLRLYGTARGRAAEYWGKNYLDADRLINIMGFADNAPEWYEKQSPDFRRYLDAFVAGMNDYAQKHPDRIADEVKVVLPIVTTDLLSYVQLGFFAFLAETGGCSRVFNLAGLESAGSNGWAIAPTHTTTKHAMLLANPHLAWSGGQTWFEAQLKSPQIDVYGATLVGFPVLGIAFNDYLGWTHTNNTIDSCDLYKLTLAEGGYRFDGEVRAFETQTKTIKIRQPDGTLSGEKLLLRRSIHGPVVEKDGSAIAIRIVGVDLFPAYGLLEELWNRGKAKNLAEFQAALQQQGLPFFNVIYSDKGGHILYLFNGYVPVRSPDNQDWQGIIPGDTSATLWTKIHSFEDLPKIIDPPNGWVQNCNDPPWTATFPPLLDPKKFPAYMAPRFMSLRAQRSVKMLAEKRFDFEQLIADKYSTHAELAERILEDLIAAARKYNNPLVREAAAVLQKWDRNADANSRGILLFQAWVNEMGENIFATAWEQNNPLTTPKGLADPRAAVTSLEAAATKIKTNYGSLDVPWGDVVRLQRGKFDLPGNGGDGEFGIFRVISYVPTTKGRYQSVFGDTYIAAVEFSNPIKAQVLNTYGNATQPGSNHIGDQLELAARKELRPVWRSRNQIYAHLEFRELF